LRISVEEIFYTTLGHFLEIEIFFIFYILSNVSGGHGEEDGGGVDLISYIYIYIHIYGSWLNEKLKCRDFKEKSLFNFLVEI
jgi:hypothetical protein